MFRTFNTGVSASFSGEVHLAECVYRVCMFRTGKSWRGLIRVGNSGTDGILRGYRVRVSVSWAVVGSMFLQCFFQSRRMSSFAREIGGNPGFRLCFGPNLRLVTVLGRKTRGFATCILCSPDWRQRTQLAIVGGEAQNGGFSRVLFASRHFRLEVPP